MCLFLSPAPRSWAALYPQRISSIVSYPSSLSSTVFPLSFVPWVRMCSDFSRTCRIWEKKFGKNANHVKNQRQQQQHRNTSAPRDSRPRQQGHGNPRGGRDAPGLPPRHVGGGRPEGFKARNTSANGQAGAPKAKEKALHPSWEAKRKLKEKLNPGIVPPQGKKIIF